jgi:CTP synthase (UTP-ammonia lyase)
MNQPFAIALLGDYKPTYKPHYEAVAVLTDFQRTVPVEFVWIPTAQLTQNADTVLAGFSGIWAGSGPYLSKAGILNGIQFARENNIPFLGTCSGFGYTVLEFARSQFGVADVRHPDEGLPLSPDALFLHPLAVCGIGTHEITFTVRPGTLAHEIYQPSGYRASNSTGPIQELSNCSYGIHPEQVTRFAEHGLHVVADDETGEGKMIEYPENDFFLATLFYPHLNSTAEKPHPILQTFLQRAAQTTQYHVAHTH